MTAPDAAQTPRTEFDTTPDAMGLGRVIVDGKFYGLPVEVVRELAAVRGQLAELNEMGGHLYCTTCGSCGEDGCCPPSACWKTRAERAESALAAAEAEALRDKCVGLWKLLDHIDTLDDAIKQNDAEFRKAVYATQRKRFAIMSGEEFDAACRGG